MQQTIIVASIVLIAVMSTTTAMAHNPADDATPTTPERPFRILKTLPFYVNCYQPAAAELFKAGVPDKYGHEEWADVVLTNEFHQHVGIYTIIGAKMGVRAKEILNAPTRAVNVTVETGGKPPLSCLIDGLQVALGSTFAQDLIHAPEQKEPRIAAVFEYKGRKIRLALKPDVLKNISEVITKAIKDCGDLTPAYFQRIEDYSYRVWAEFDRNTIFDEET